MKYSEIVETYFEEASNGGKLVIVDVQPHDIGTHIHFDMDEFAEMVNSYDDILVFFNGESLGWESTLEMQQYYEEIGIDTEKCEFAEKEYAFFRDLMDGGVDDDTMVKLGKWMMQNDYWSTHDFEYGDIPSEFNPFDDEDEMEDRKFYIPDDTAAIMKGWNGADICGGGRHECLEEILILGRIQDIHFTQLSEWIYG